MRILFDQGTPAPLRQALGGHTVETAFERGWSRLRNGELIAAAESAGFDVFVTTDRNLKHQLNLLHRSLAIVVLGTTSWPRPQRALPVIVSAIERSSGGSYEEVTIDVQH